MGIRFCAGCYGGTTRNHHHHQQNHRYSSTSRTIRTRSITNSSTVVHDLVLFLYIQSYKRLLPRTHKDSAAVADVWPSTSAFDGYLSALSPLQVLTMDRFEHLGLLIQYGYKGSEGNSLSQWPS
ncbi:hypothetical protein P8452_40730 [Trifolium repens]|nr:hypothetical protein P8452_40730 [Trifolium repens]